MYWPDIIDLKVFYSAPLGLVAQRSLNRAIQRIWPHAQNECVLGIGYCLPCMPALAAQAQKALVLMPASQGALHWPPGKPNSTFLADEHRIPLEDECMNRVFVLHSFENTEQLRQMLQEIWRILTPEGRVLVAVPNRSGVWARAVGSPFAQGRPYSASQLRTVLKDHSFTPLRNEYALFAPPRSSRFMLRLSRLFEIIGRRFFWPFGGVVLLEAEKHVFATRAQKVERVRTEQSYEGVAKPAMTFNAASLKKQDRKPHPR